MSKQFPLINVMSPAQQRQAVKILKGIVKTDDEQNPGQSGYCDHEDTHEIRMLLIKSGQMTDRRKAGRKCRK